MLTRRPYLCFAVCLWAVLCVLPVGVPQLVSAQDEGEEAKERPEAEDAYLYEEVADDRYRYDPAGKRDPFASPFNLVAESRPSDIEPRTPLQRFELGQLKLVGVILNARESKALIEDTKGLGYVVTPGTLIGSKGGVVKAIEPRRILVEEVEIDFYGKRRHRERELKLITTQATTDAKGDR